MENKSGYIRYVLYVLSFYSDLGFSEAELRTVAESRSSDEDKVNPPGIRLDSPASDTLTFGNNTVPKDNSYCSHSHDIDNMCLLCRSMVIHDELIALAPTT